MSATVHHIRSVITSDADDNPTPALDVSVRVNDDEDVAAVLADIRDRHARDEPTPVTARHLDALGLRDAVLTLALSES